MEEASGWSPLSVTRPHSKCSHGLRSLWPAGARAASLKEEREETQSVSAQLQLDQDCQVVYGSDLAYDGNITRLSFFLF